MAEENISQNFRLESTYEIGNYFVKKKNKNDLTNKKHKKFTGLIITLNTYLF